MRHTAALTLIVILSFSCSSEKNNLQSDLALSNLKGKVWKIDKTVHDTKESCNCPASMRSDSKRTVSVYNEKGFLTEISIIGDEGNVIASSRYIYSKKGSRLGLERYSGDKLTGKELIVARGGKVAEVQIVNRDGYKEKSCSFSYSGENISEEITKNDLGNPVSFVSNTYEEGQLSSQTEKDADGNILTVSRFSRNSNNDVIEYLISVPKENRDSKFTFEYEYDEAGNWIKQTQFYDGNIMSVVLRNITYYN